jgi:hypothetical protein
LISNILMLTICDRLGMASPLLWNWCTASEDHGLRQAVARALPHAARK